MVCSYAPVDTKFRPIGFILFTEETQSNKRSEYKAGLSRKQGAKGKCFGTYQGLLVCR